MLLHVGGIWYIEHIFLKYLLYKRVCWTLIYFEVFFIFEEAEPRRVRRGAGTCLFGPYVSKKLACPQPTAQFRPRE